MHNQVDASMRIPPSVLKSHNKKEDACTTITGKLYDMTPYLHITRVARRSSSEHWAEMEPSCFP
ncbi:hypothetical protein C8R48DRAFT_42271 [Suillus tomentosus]|nr:hypothetical protein C8R48DRAFT_42271 [Suillus tomentosus]